MVSNHQHKHNRKNNHDFRLCSVLSRHCHRMMCDCKDNPETKLNPFHMNDLNRYKTNFQICVFIYITYNLQAEHTDNKTNYYDYLFVIFASNTGGIVL